MQQVLVVGVNGEQRDYSMYDVVWVFGWWLLDVLVWDMRVGAAYSR